ncbi:hypothetical protein HK097_004517 [Rhizophlyctis rosea]|uniref:Uncharacterized protein n=1 Tax=Rhizophlyctis rosea TaxID=64517 RepID=A0AAD5X017_9FUNG|nr:hypothetical protein HK097_004517 [Rhizophlyctis rosea]
MVPLIRFIILDDALGSDRGNGLYVASVLDWVVGWAMGGSADSDRLVAELVSLFLNVLKSLPVASADDEGTHLALINRVLVLVNKVGQQQRKAVHFALLARICDLHYAGLPAISELHALSHLVINSTLNMKDTLTASILMSTMSYLLLDSPDVDIERGLVLDILTHVMKSADIDVPPINVVVRVVVYPLLQTVGETQNPKVRRRAFDVMTIYERVAAIDCLAYDAASVEEVSIC